MPCPPPSTPTSWISPREPRRPSPSGPPGSYSGRSRATAGPPPWPSGCRSPSATGPSPATPAAISSAGAGPAHPQRQRPRPGDHRLRQYAREQLVQLQCQLHRRSRAAVGSAEQHRERHHHGATLRLLLHAGELPPVGGNSTCRSWGWIATRVYQDVNYTLSDGPGPVPAVVWSGRWKLLLPAQHSRRGCGLPVHLPALGASSGRMNARPLLSFRAARRGISFGTFRVR